MDSGLALLKRGDYFRPWPTGVSESETKDVGDGGDVEAVLM